MEMCYDGALVMPSSYAVMNEEEMTYVDGGWRVDNKWWGCEVFLTHEERKTVTCVQTIAAAGFAMPAPVGSVIVGAVASIISNYDDGNGVMLRLTRNPMTGLVLTGVYSISADTENWVINNPGMH